MVEVWRIARSREGCRSRDVPTRDAGLGVFNHQTFLWPNEWHHRRVRAVHSLQSNPIDLRFRLSQYRVFRRDDHRAQVRDGAASERPLDLLSPSA